MQHLIDGFRKFQAEAFGQRSDLFKHLATTQPPGTLFVSCSDSRVVPELLTQQEPGDLLPLTEEQIAEMQAAAERERAETAAVLKELMDE